METVKYLCPVPQEHGHWVQPENEPQRVITDQKWVAIEKEVEDALTTTRRCLREKTSVRKMEVEEKEPKSEENAEKEKFQQLKQRLCEIIDEEMKHMVEWVANMKRMMEEPSEEDDILQTKVISSREVASSWKSWLAAIDAEVRSLLKEKEALKKITRKELGDSRKSIPGGLRCGDHTVQTGLHDQSWSKWWQAQNPLGDMREPRVQKGFRADLLQRS